MTHWETLTETERLNIFLEPVDKGFEGAVPHGISVINNTIYWTEDRELDQENPQITRPQITRPGAIYSLNLLTNTPQRLLQNNSLSPQDVSTFINISGVFECVLHYVWPCTSLVPRPPKSPHRIPPNSRTPLN